MKHFTWLGEKNRPVRLSRPCPCGCDLRDGGDFVGYVSGSDKQGKGFTVEIDDESVYRAISKIMPVYEGKLFQVTA